MSNISAYRKAKATAYAELQHQLGYIDLSNGHSILRRLLKEITRAHLAPDRFGHRLIPARQTLELISCGIIAMPNNA